MFKEERPREEPTELFRTLKKEIGDVLGSVGEFYMTSLTSCSWVIDGLRINIMESVFDPCTYLDLGIRKDTGAPAKVTPGLREKLEKVVSIFRQSIRRSGREHRIGCTGRVFIPFKRRRSRKIVSEILDLTSK